MNIFITLNLFYLNKKQCSSNEILLVDHMCLSLLSPEIPLNWPKERVQYMFGRRKAETELSGVSCSLLHEMYVEALRIHAEKAEPEKAEH